MLLALFTFLPLLLWTLSALAAAFTSRGSNSGGGSAAESARKGVKGVRASFLLHNAPMTPLWVQEARSLLRWLERGPSCEDPAKRTGLILEFIILSKY